MSHRKFEAPRHGSLAFLPKKRASSYRGQLRAHEKDDPSTPLHLTGFIGIKAGMTHVVREVDCPGAKMHRKEIVEAVTIVEAPPMVVVGVIGYQSTPEGLRIISPVWAEHLSEGFKRRYKRRWHLSNKNAFAEHSKKYENGAAEIQDKLQEIKDKAEVVRVIAHTQPERLPVNQKKAHIIELQVNGGSVPEKVDWAFAHFEKEVSVGSVFQPNEHIDVCAITKGHGFESTTTRWGTKRLQKKSRKGNRKVGCVGAWHPANIRYTVARAGQHGYHHRIDIRKKIYRIADGASIDGGSTEYDLTKKQITPMGGFPKYGHVKNDFLMIKGTCPGPKRRFLTLRRNLFVGPTKGDGETGSLKMIDTASKYGNGRFQTVEEKRAFMGVLKKDLKEIV